MLQDRRAAQRLSLSSPMRYQRKGSQLFGNSIGQDISESGIGFISHEFLPVSTHLIFEVRHPETREFVKAPGEVVWISNLPHSERFSVGAKFIEPVTPV